MKYLGAFAVEPIPGGTKIAAFRGTVWQQELDDPTALVILEGRLAPGDTLVVDASTDGCRTFEAAATGEIVG